MKHCIIFAALAVVAAIPTAPTPTRLTKWKNCIDYCKCKSSMLQSRLQIVECDRPLVLNETTFQYVNKHAINIISLENIIITQVQEGALKGFKNLDDVLIINSKIGSIDAKAFNDVKRLKFSNCGFEDRPDLFSEKLEELNFGDCRLEEIPKLNGLLSLTFLNLSGNFIKNIEIETFAQLFDLEELYLSDNEIFKLPPTIFINNGELNSLYLDNNPMKHFYLNTSENLETLSLKNCQLETFDERSTKRLSTLNELILSHNNIKNLSSRALSHMKELSVINLSYNKLEKLDDDIFSANPHLNKITLDGNKFKTLPNFYLTNGDSFSTYSFSCKYCGLKTLSSSVFQNMAGIIRMELSHNKFMNVDNIFEKLLSLKLLDISYNNIAYISPLAFQNNRNLETLNIGGNSLMTLNPEVFANNHVLRELDARNASLQKLWSNTNRPINSLHKILLGDNQLTSFSEEDFKIMPNLEAIDLSNNPLIFADKLCNLIRWLQMIGVSPIEYTKNLNSDFGRTFGEDIDGFSAIEWKEFHNRRCPDFIEYKPSPENIDDDSNDSDDSTSLYDDDDYNYDEDEEVFNNYLQTENSNLTKASYILSFTSVFILSALVVLTVAVTVTICILRRNTNFDMHRANLPRLKIPLWHTTPGQKKHSGSVYRPLSEDLSGPKTPKLSRYEFTATPTVHSSS